MVSACADARPASRSRSHTPRPTRAPPRRRRTQRLSDADLLVNRKPALPARGRPTHENARSQGKRPFVGKRVAEVRCTLAPMQTQESVPSARQDPELLVGDSDAPPPPMLSGTPLVGHLFDFLRDPFELFIRGYRTHGPIFRVRVPGRSFVAMSGAEGIRFVAKHEKDVFASGPIFDDFVRLVGGRRALVNVDGDIHADLRKRFRPAMSRSTFEQALPRVREVTQERLLALDGTVVPIERFARDLVFHQLSAIMGVGTLDAESIQDPLIRVMHTALEVTVARRWPGFMLKDPRFVRSLAQVKRMALELASHGRADDPSEGLFPVLRRAVADGVLDEVDVPMLALTPYFAGIDTVAASLSFLLAEVLRDPSLRARLREEAASASASDAQGRGYLDRLVRITAAKDESMRCHPVILTMIRRAMKPFRYNGYAVKAGEDVMISIGAQHVMSEHFPDPRRFDAERFLRADTPKPPAGAFGPYGGGAHSCLGAALADAQLVATLAHLLEHADLELLEPERPLRTVFDPYPLPADDRVRVRLRRQ